MSVASTRGYKKGTPGRVAESLIGRVFGRGTVFAECARDVSPKGRRESRWQLLCVCGEIYDVRRSNLVSGATLSCGCLLRERITESRYVHGRVGTPEYIVWAGMVARCTYAKHKAYRQYGGRGICVCDEWRDSFAAFFRDMGERPTAKHSLERINNNGNYEPGNVRWATRQEQNNNRSNNHVLEYGGERKTLANWARSLGVPARRLHSRLAYGWSVERTLTEPPRASRRSVAEAKPEVA